MDLQAILSLFDRDQRQEIDFPGMTREAFPHLIRFVRPAPGASYILYTDLDGAVLVGDERAAAVAGDEWSLVGHVVCPTLLYH